MNNISSIKSALIVLFALTTLISCKKEFDSPPFPTDPNIVVNTSIATIKNMHTVNGAIEVINSDMVISGVVIANDKSGNFYKQIFIHDSTGAMQILIDGASLFNTYPIGRKVFIKCKGLALGDYKGTMVLGVKALVGGVYSVQGIPSSLSYNYVLGGSLNNPVAPVSVSTISQLGTTFSDRYMNELIKMDAMEFTKYNVDTNHIDFTYGDISNYKSTIYRYITPGCNSRDSIEVTTSGYANFAGIKLPRGNGSITGIYSISRTSPTSANAYKQMMLRDTSDIQFYGSRCGAPPIGSVVLLNEDFETQNATTGAPYNPISITGWTNISEIGTRTYSGKIFGGNKYAYLTAFGSGGQVKTWLVTKGINLNNTSSEQLSFSTQQDYSSNGASSLKVLVSSNYTGTGSPWNSTWTDITSQATLCPPSTSNFPGYVPSGNINLSSYTGTIFIAFVYDGTDPGSSSTWEIDNIRVLGL